MYVQKQAIRVRAWQLGAETEKEKEMLKSGRMKLRPDGNYELFSQEAAGPTGQIAEPGDYFKTDPTGRPYPNDKAYFEAMHERIEGDLYLQKAPVLYAWTEGEPVGETVRYLLDSGLLKISEDDPERYYSAFLWGTTETAARDAVVVVHGVERNDKNEITDVKFNFVARDYFDSVYRVVRE